MEDPPYTTNDSTMTEKSMDQQLWNRYWIASEKDRNFVDAKNPQVLRKGEEHPVSKLCIKIRKRFFMYSDGE